MGLDYSQKRLLSTALHAKGRGAKTRRLQLAAFWTGFASMIISLVHVFLVASQ